MMKQFFFYGVIALSLLSCQPQQAPNNGATTTDELTDTSIVGAWEILEASVTTEDTSFVYPPHRSIIIYTDKFYSVEIAHEDRPSWPKRAEGEQVSYEDLSNAYSNFTSNSGRYEVRGDSIFYEVIVSKNPATMNNPLKWHYRFTLDGDKLTTYHSWTSRSFSYTYRRLQ